MRQNNLTENRDTRPSLVANFFSIPDFLSNTECVLYEKFRHCETNFSTEKRDNPSPPSSLAIFHKFFDTRILVEHRRVPLRSLSVLLRQQIFFGKSLHNLLKQKSLPPSLAIFHKFFYQNSCGTQKGSPTKSIYFETTNFLWEIVALLKQKFFDTRT